MKLKDLVSTAFERLMDDVQEGIADVKAEARELAARWYGVQVYVYGFPLVIADVTREISTTAPPPTGTPVNRICHARRFPDASTFVKAARTGLDALFTSAWLDLAAGPIVLSVPDTHGRHYVLALLDLWTDVFASIGKRTTGTGPASFLIVGPDWSGEAPAGVTRTFRSPTRFAWLLGQTQTNGPADYAAVNAIQDGYTLTPLAASEAPATQPPAAQGTSLTPAVEQLQAMDAATFFTRLARLMKDNPPGPRDAPMIEKMRRIGIHPGEDLDFGALDPAVVRGLERAAPDAFALLRAMTTRGKTVDGWAAVNPDMGNYGADYKLRAGVALAGIGANLPADTIYSLCFVDSDGEPLDGARRYVLHLDRGQTPPVHATWSISMYDPAGHYVPNHLDRYNLAPWMPLTYNADGSLDLHIQASSPGPELEANWLPAPQAGPFNLMLRAYWPKEALLAGSYRLPGVRRTA